MDYLERFVQQHKLEEAIKKMTPKFKVGDKVKCIPNKNGASHSMYCGAGWILNKEFVVAEVTSWGANDPIYWPGNGEAGVYESALELVTINKTKMGTRTFTNSQKIRLRLKVYWDKDDCGYDDFEEFYTAFTDAILDNLEFLAEMFDL